MRSPPQIAQRAFVLLAVLVALAVALLVAAGAIAIARGALADTRGGARSALARAAALDAVALVSATLAQSRRELLTGGIPPDFPSRDGMVLEQPQGDERIVARLVPFADGKFFEAEAGKLSNAEVEDNTLERLLEGAGLTIGVAEFREQLASKADDALDLTMPGTRAWFTSFATEPMIDGDGEPRVVCSATLSEESAQRLRRTGEDALLAVARRVAADNSGDVEKFEARIVRALIAEGIATPEWRDALMLLTTINGERVSGRVSVSHAPIEVLRALEGIGAERAARIVEERALLNPEERRSTAWLVERGILTSEEFLAIVSQVTARSLQWRFRVEASFEPLESTVAPSRSETARNLARFDCIVDCAQEVPRLSLLRDISMLSALAAIAAKEQPSEDDRGRSTPQGDAANIAEDRATIADNAALEFADVVFSKSEFSSRQQMDSEKMVPSPDAAGPVGAPPVGRWVSSGKTGSTEPRSKR